MKISGSFGQVFWKIFSHFSILGKFCAALQVDFFQFCFVSGRLRAGFWPSHLVFQAYLEAFSEAWLSYFFGFGCHNLGGHLSRASLKGFRGTLKGFLWIFFKKTLSTDHPCHLWEMFFENQRWRATLLLSNQTTCCNKIVVCTLLHLKHYTKHHCWYLICY